jgi:hypothetical protein
MKTQMEISESLLGMCREQLPSLRVLRTALEQLLDESQNPPPVGGSDGTMTADRYNDLRFIEQSVSKLMAGIVRAR